MNLLAFDTSDQACSIALQIGEQGFYRHELAPRRHTERLLPLIGELLNDAQMPLSALDVIAYGAGPGGFTGLRIATGIAQGLAYGSAKPLVGLSTLQGMAQQIHQQYQHPAVCVGIDARMQQIYWGTYVYDESTGIMQPWQPEQLSHPDSDLAATFLTAYPEAVLTGSLCNMTTRPALALAQHFAQQYSQIVCPNAQYYLPLAKLQMQRGQFYSALEATPMYIRNQVAQKSQKNKVVRG